MQSAPPVLIPTNASPTGAAPLGALAFFTLSAAYGLERAPTTSGPTT